MNPLLSNVSHYRSSTHWSKGAPPPHAAARLLHIFPAAASLCRGTTVYQGPGERAPNNLRPHNDTLKPLQVFIVSRDEGSRAHGWPAEESQYAAMILSLPGSHPTGSAQPLYSRCPVLSPVKVLTGPGQS